MELLTLEQFAGCVNETFTATLPQMTLDFVLVEARPLPRQGKQAARMPFSLLFRNSAPIVFAQQVYPLSHPRIGQAGIFLVPIAQERGGFLYQAIYN